jgi:hypothetical protein
MTRKQINTRKDGVTKDMVADQGGRVQSYTFDGLGVTVQATSYAEALKKAKAKVKSKK